MVLGRAVSIESFEKKKTTKGKKKVRNVEEKAKKGLNLSRIDKLKLEKRKKMRELKDKVQTNVKEEMEKLGIVPTRTRRLSSCSESSFGSAPPPKKEKKKRVSFSSALEHRKVFDKTTDVVNARASSASPGRSILARKLKAEAAAAAKVKSESKAVKPKLEFDTSMDVTVDDNEVEEKENAPVKEGVKKPKREEKGKRGDKATDKTKKKGVADGKVKKRGTVQVTKKVKEQILAMPRKERKAFLLELRAKTKPNVNLVQQCKALHEKVRVKKRSTPEKDALVTELVGLVKGHAKELIYAHDMSRIFQFLLKLEREGVTSMLFDELCPELVRMTKSPYSRYFVKRMLKYGTRAQRTTIIQAFRGHCVSMMKNIYSADILEDVYNEFTNAQQRFDINIEFYGKEFIVLKPETIMTLDEIIAAHPDKKKMIVEHLEEVIHSFVDKVIVKHSLAHKIMLDFVEHCDAEQKTSLIDSLKDKIPEIVHTPYGSKLSMKCVWDASAKERKMIVKNFKDLAINAAVDKNGQRVLCAIFDQVDDTVLINKYITTEIANDIAKVCGTEWGNYLLQYIAHPRDGRAMDWNIIQELKKGDDNAHSKKPKKDRYAAIFKAIVNPLLTYMSANMEEMLFGEQANMMSHLLLKVLELPMALDLFDREVDPADRLACHEAIAELAKIEFIPMNPDRFHLVEDKHAGYTVGQLLRQDNRLPEEQRLSVTLCEKLDTKALGSWIACNKGCFVLLRMFENGGPTVQEKIKSAVNMARLTKYTFVGAKMLKEAITGEKVEK